MVVRVIQIARLLIILASRHRSLVFENLALRQQLAVYHRTPFEADRWSDRLFWVGLRLAWPEWKSALVIVRPATVIAWHRRGFAWYWTRRSRPRGGRPEVGADVRRLTREMARANPLWGARRIHGELLKLGFDVSERTISRLMPRRRTPPSQTWRTFLKNHLGSTVAVDFFAVPTLTLPNPIRLRCAGRRPATPPACQCDAAPYVSMDGQQLREAFPHDANARFLLHDRDTTFDAAFGRAVEAFGLTAVRTAPRSLALAESLRRTRHRLDPPRVSGPRHRLQ
jgi:putative transposase